jgi:nucleoside 2-deoxyribosyltransferase
MNLYLAGPLFTVGEKWWNAKLAHALRQLGYGVFLPQEHEPKHADKATEIFQTDVGGMDWADGIIANMDGADPDSGTSWELGYMYAKGKPALLYRTDFRTACGDFDGQMVNLMLTCGASAIVKYQHGAGVEADAERLAELIHNRVRHWCP